MQALLQRCRERLDASELVGQLEKGLGDDSDIRKVCHTMVIAVAASHPNAVLSHLSALLVLLQATLKTRMKSNPVQQEVRRLLGVVAAAGLFVVFLFNICSSAVKRMLCVISSQMHAVRYGCCMRASVIRGLDFPIAGCALQVDLQHRVLVREGFGPSQQVVLCRLETS